MEPVVCMYAYVCDTDIERLILRIGSQDDGGCHVQNLQGRVITFELHWLPQMKDYGGAQEGSLGRVV